MAGGRTDANGRAEEKAGGERTKYYVLEVNFKSYLYECTTMIDIHDFVVGEVTSKANT